MSSWHKKEISEVALEFGTDINNGRINVITDRKRRGDNNVFLLPSVDSRAVLKRLVSDASFALLAVVYLIAAILGRVTEAISGMSFLLFMFILVFGVKYSSSKRIINSYRLLLPSAKVIESGNNIRLSVFDVEVGDLIEFSQGDIIPADARIVSSTGLVVAERYYDFDTGKISYRREEKSSDKIVDFEGDADTYGNMLYAASMVVSGKGKAIVTATGKDTRLSGTGSAMRVVSSDDTPAYVTRFSGRSKLISLLAFFAVIPFTFIITATRSSVNSPENGFDFFYTFLLLLSLSVTCMSELVIMPADTLLTKELLVSSRSVKSGNFNRSRLTKLSSADEIADTDTVLILNPNVMTDTSFSVRRIYFSGKQFRFDTLRSNALSSFAESIYPAVRFANSHSDEILAIKSFLNDSSFQFSKEVRSDKPRMLRNYPLPGAKACVFKSDEQGRPVEFLSFSKDSTLLAKCVKFRAEGGALWTLNEKDFFGIRTAFEEYSTLGLKIVSFYSSDPYDGDLIFEGLVGVGQEYPFADGELNEEFSVSGIQPILFYDKENESNINHAMNCGLIIRREDIALASDYRRNGLNITDAPLATKAYVGFGRDSVTALTSRLLSNSRRVLPIIRESADRRAVSPLRVYATQMNDSHDSVIISSSLSLRPADSESRQGGLYDALTLIRGCSMARLKLGVYKNYLAFSTFFRIAAVCGSLMLGNSGYYLNSLMILILGFLCDSVALLSLMASKGIPVNPKAAVADSKMMFSPSLFAFFSAAGLLSGALALITCELSPMIANLPAAATASMLTLTGIVTQIFAIGGFLIILNKHSRRAAFNWFYICALLISGAFAVLQSFTGEAMFNRLHSLNIFRIDISALPFVAICAVISLGCVILISALLSKFSGSKIK